MVIDRGAYSGTAPVHNVQPLVRVESASSSHIKA
jgi:hypothetical protein